VARVPAPTGDKGEKQDGDYKKNICQHGRSQEFHHVY